MPAISNIKIVGIGGAGLSILTDLFAEMPEASYVAIDSDEDALAQCPVERKISLIDNGEGAGGDTEIAKKAAITKISDLQLLSSDTRLLIVIAGLGGGTGSVVAPMVSKIISENPECEIFSFSTLPLSIEGEEKIELARKAKEYLARRCKAAFALPNDIILARQNTPIAEAYANANAHIVNAVRATVKGATSDGIVNIDFPTLIKIFSKNEESKTQSFAAFGRGYGENAVEESIDELLKSPLLPQNFKARSMLLSLRCHTTFEMNKMQTLLELASKKFGSPSRLAFGAITETDFLDNIEVCALGLCEVEEPSCSELPEQHKETSVNEQKQEDVTPKTLEVSEENESFSNDAQTSNIQPEPNQNQSESLMSSKVKENIVKDNVAIIREEIKVSPPPEREDISVKPVPVETERRSFFGFGRRKKSAKKTDPENVDKRQTEFVFMSLSEQRGFFLDTPPNIRNGEDLDIPTYMRKGIKINL